MLGNPRIAGNAGTRSGATLLRTDPVSHIMRLDREEILVADRLDPFLQISFQPLSSKVRDGGRTRALWLLHFAITKPGTESPPSRFDFSLSEDVITRQNSSMRLSLYSEWLPTYIKRDILPKCSQRLAFVMFRHGKTSFCLG